jgi:hypothetical protein
VIYNDLKAEDSNAVVAFVSRFRIPKPSETETVYVPQAYIHSGKIALGPQDLLSKFY